MARNSREKRLSPGRNVRDRYFPGLRERDPIEVPQAVSVNFPVLVVGIVDQLAVFVEKGARNRDVQPVGHNASRNRDGLQEAPRCHLRSLYVAHAPERPRDIQVGPNTRRQCLAIGAHKSNDGSSRQPFQAGAMARQTFGKHRRPKRGTDRIVEQARHVAVKGHVVSQAAIEARIEPDDMLERPEIATPDRRTTIERLNEFGVGADRVRQQDDPPSAITARFDRRPRSTIEPDKISAAAQKHDTITKVRMSVDDFDIDGCPRKSVEGRSKDQAIADISLIGHEQDGLARELSEKDIDLRSHHLCGRGHLRFKVPDSPSRRMRVACKR